MPESALDWVLRSADRRARLIRFGVVGGATSLAYGVLVAVQVEGLHLSAPVAAALSYLGLMPLNYLGHRRATWRSAAPRRPEVQRFVLAHGVTMLACTALMAVVNGGLGWPYWAGSALIIVLAPVMNFVLFELWVFTRPFHRQGPEVKFPGPDEP